MKKLEKYAEKQFDDFRYLITQPVPAFEAETFHAFRVHIKKIRSLTQFLAYSFGDFNRKKTKKVFDKLFGLAGKIREIEIETFKLNSYITKGLLPRYKRILNREHAAAREQFFYRLAQVDLKAIKKIKRSVSGFARRVKRQMLTLYLEAVEADIHSMYSCGLGDEKQTHECRKELKQFLYIEKSVGVTNHSNKIVSYTAIAELLGDWHDCRVIAKHLEAGNSHLIPLDERRVLEKIRTDLLSQACFLLGEVKAQLQQQHIRQQSPSSFK